MRNYKPWKGAINILSDIRKSSYIGKYRPFRAWRVLVATCTGLHPVLIDWALSGLLVSISVSYFNPETWGEQKLGVKMWNVKCEMWILSFAVFSPGNFAWSGKSTKYKERSTNGSGKYKVRRTNYGRLVPNFVLRHSYLVLRITSGTVKSEIWNLKCEFYALLNSPQKFLLILNVNRNTAPNGA
jgi:hypothetical protein